LVAARPAAAVPAVAPPPEAPVEQLACAPCKKIVFTSARDGDPDIYSIDADGTDLVRLTHDAARDDHAAWSPDGQRIVFTSRIGDDSTLVVMDADGSNVARHALPHRFVTEPRWSPDGARITYSALSDGSQNVFVVDAGGGWPSLLFSAPGWDGQSSWSPDGKQLALASDWLAYDFVFDVFRIDADGTRFTLLTDGNIFDGVDYLWPAWSPTGAKIALTLSQEIEIDRYLTYVGVMNRDGSGLTPLIAAAKWSKSSWSPDGTMIAFTTGSAAGYDVSWVKADGSARGTVITNGWDPDWQP
jgi:TolB protein